MTKPSKPKPKLQVPLNKWFEEQHRQVTRGDLLKVLTVYERAKRREALERRWYRRLYRWLTTEIIKPPAMAPTVEPLPAGEEELRP